MVNLICRYYDLEYGKIKINGEDYKTYSIRSLRDKIGYIMQKVVIFDGTILENINYANKDISKDEIIEICKKMNLHEKIISLKDGYESKIGKKGIALSKGQRQRLVLVRAFTKPKSIMIFDDSFSAIDKVNKKQILDNLMNMENSFTKIVITHDIELTRKFDKVIYINNKNVIVRET